MSIYHHLPLHLKRCFAYCSIFPKDYEFEKTQVVLLWMAEGLIQQEENIEMEDLGMEYFDNLVSWSLFQQSSKDKSRFLMHEIVNYLAKLAAGDTCFRMQERAEGNEQDQDNFEKIRHMSYLGGEYDSFDMFEVFSRLTHLRTFLPLTPVTCYLDFRVPLQLYPRLQRLRVLSLRGYVITGLSDSIGKLKLLRYLDLSKTSIRSMPESITDLYNLQTLLLEDCFHLDKLPSMFGNLVNLRHLNILGATKLEGMPRQIGQLKFLQTLSNVVIGDGGCFGIKDLASLSHLQGTLRISNLEKVTELQHARDADLINKTKISVLSLEWSESMRDGTNELNVLNMLQPHNGLKVLTISCYGGTEFPSWLKSPSFHDMVVLTIENCKECESLPPIGQLPALKVLTIRGMAKVMNVGPEFRGTGFSPFRSLETLHFENMKEWKGWSSCEEFPNLCELSLRSCPKLSGYIPKHLPLLKKVQIDGCGKLPILVSNFPDLCELEVEGSKGVVCRSMDGFSSSELKFLSKSLRFTSQIEGFSMQGLTNAEDLTIFACEELKCLWSVVEEPSPHLQFLRLLHIDNCPKLVSLVSEEVEARLQPGTPSMLSEIVIKNCMVLKSLPKAMMYNNNCLQLIRIVKCHSLKHIARGQLPPTLERLEVSYCQNMEIILLVDSDTSSCSSTTSQLEYLRIQYCPSLKSLTSYRELPRSLKHLNLFGCPQLESIANRFHYNSFLECIEISDCENLQSLPTGINALSTLRDIDIRNCPSLHLSLDRDLLPANLRALHISDCVEVSALPEAIHNLTSLEKLTMHHCSVVPFPRPNLLTNLASLTISHVRNSTDASFGWGLDNLISLNKLEIRKLEPVSFSKMMFPASLKILTISDFPNLQHLSSKGFSKLASLKELYISECRKLEFFPKDGLPPSLLKLCLTKCEKLRSFPKKGLPLLLQELYVFQCPKLAKRCKKDQGREGKKIAHVLRVQFHTNLNRRPSDPL
ncbi:putative disease resistance protein At3g14460 [Juglans regia]|uniref:Disease resistance protein At3g14460 n=2 Tax=Juglans regia TaxID=51240 RepID=A0A2I4HPF3_JUGRE|nr:putative disease resistance protein At3g14460 [Juglans regia]